jgi:hypothetical protein
MRVFQEAQTRIGELSASPIGVRNVPLVAGFARIVVWMQNCTI